MAKKSVKKVEPKVLCPSCGSSKVKVRLVSKVRGNRYSCLDCHCPFRG